MRRFSKVAVKGEYCCKLRSGKVYNVYDEDSCDEEGGPEDGRMVHGGRTRTEGGTEGGRTVGRRVGGERTGYKGDADDSDILIEGVRYKAVC